jgi:Carboxypeptidase regulatory-like domain
MIRFFWSGVLATLLVMLLLPHNAGAQQTLGAINGTVTDTSGAVVQGVEIKIHNADTGLDVKATTKSDGSFNVADLPIGKYSVSFSKPGFKAADYTQINVQGNRGSTVNAILQAGEVTTQVTVNGTPMLNQTDTTNGYTLGETLIQSTPLGTGSFTQLAVLAPGVSADFLNSSGTSGGLGNQNIFSNGQRDTSNSFAFNGVNANNVFNGKSSSSVSNNRFVLNTGETFGIGGEIQTSTSVYDAIGQGLPTPPPETIEELNVNTSMYDASQGANSGAHISLQTKSGTNAFHGQLYEYHQTDAWNAAPFFRNAGGTVGLDGENAVPALKRNVFGGTIGGPIFKDKIFFFASYQGLRAHDQDSSLSGVFVPQGLTSDRSAGALANVANADFFTTLTAAQINPVALAILNAKAPDGTLEFPNPILTDPMLIQQLGFNAVVKGPVTTLTADQVNGNVDYNISAKDRLSAKYYFQRDPTVAPFSASSLDGFPQTLTAGSQVVSISNTRILGPNATWTQRFGFVRESALDTTAQGFSQSDFGISIPGSNRLPGINIGTTYQDFTQFVFGGLRFGPASNFSDAGIFQNQFEWATDLTWNLGRHTAAFGFLWDRNQLNVLNKQNQVAQLGFNDFPGFLTGALCNPTNSCSFAGNSTLLNGETNRYYRSNQVGVYATDSFKLKPNLTISFGLRWDWDGPLSEKNGFLTNFYPQNYNYNFGTDTIQNIGLVVAGNNKAFGTPGVSASTLTGRQWGFAPRFGLVYAPSFLKNVVIRTGFGIFYDRGEFFTELSPSAGGGISGPFGVTVEQPFVVPFFSPPNATFASPFGSSPPPPPPNNLSGITQLIPNIAQLSADTTPFCLANGQSFCGPLDFAGYDPRNTLPYSENWTLDVQWQPENSLVLDLAYVGNRGIHEVIPIPFNQAGLATPTSPIHGQIYSYGYNTPGVSAESLSTLVGGFGAGNADIRVPFIGYDPNSQYNKAEGQSHYNALQFSVTKHASHGLTVAGSYTWSHSLDDESGAQLFYNGNNPLAPSTGYGNSDFDRTHVFSVSYRYEFPKAESLHGFAAQVVNGWGISGLTVAQSGSPYSVIDFSGGVASIFYGGGQDAVTNPIVPIGGVGSTTTQPKFPGGTGLSPSSPLLNPGAFGVPLLAAGQSGVPPCDPVTGACDNFETGFAAGGRNAFRGPFQTRFDFALFKDFKLTERFGLRYDVQAFNIFNHPSFDTPNNNVLFNPSFRNPPIYGPLGGDPGTVTPCVAATGAYLCPPSGQLGLIQHTIGSPRFLQMALHLTF